MGGGDLNMKKFFHPLTFENLERVWNAEEKKRLEEEKTTELQKELQEEHRREELQRIAVESGLKKKKTEKLDWMYQNTLASANTDEYLLGKRIDANVEAMKEAPAAALAVIEKKPAQKKAPVVNAKEVLLKMKEDPLFLIKKREEENRQELQQNPQKMRKIRALLEEQMGGKEKKKKSEKKKKKKEKKKKMKKERKETSPDNNSDSDDHGHNIRIKHETNDRSYSNPHSRKRKQSYSEEDHPKDAYRKHQKSDSNCNNRIKTESSRNDSHTREVRIKTELSDSDSPKLLSRYKSSRSRGSMKSEDSSEKRYGLVTLKDKIKIEQDDSDEADSRNDKQHTKRQNDTSLHHIRIKKEDCSSSAHSDSDDDRDAHRSRMTKEKRSERLEKDGDRVLDKKKPERQSYKNDRASCGTLDSVEMERRRAEMMGNAKWRDEQRGRDVKKTEEKDKLEVEGVNEMLKRSDEASKASFLKKMEVDSFSSTHTSSVEDRIKRNIHSKQRTQAAQDKKFTSR